MNLPIFHLNLSLKTYNNFHLFSNLFYFSCNREREILSYSPLSMYVSVCVSSVTLLSFFNGVKRIFGWSQNNNTNNKSSSKFLLSMVWPREQCQNETSNKFKVTPPPFRFTWFTSFNYLYTDDVFCDERCFIYDNKLGPRHCGMMNEKISSIT